MPPSISEPIVPFAKLNLPSAEEYRKRKVALISGTVSTPEAYGDK